MTVKEIISELQKFNQEEEVFVRTELCEGTDLDVLAIEAREDLDGIAIRAEPPPTL